MNISQQLNQLTLISEWFFLVWFSQNYDVIESYVLKVMSLQSYEFDILDEFDCRWYLQLT